MKQKTIQEVNEIYELEIPRILKTIKKQKAKKILLQFPDGLKPYAQIIVDEIENKTNSQCFIWMDSCYGACDIPIETKSLRISLIIQFGHSKWNYREF